jgi:hypothetical protein
MYYDSLRATSYVQARPIYLARGEDPLSSPVMMCMHYDVQTRISVTVILNLTLPPSPAPHQLSQKRGAARACFRAMRPTCRVKPVRLCIYLIIFFYIIILFLRIELTEKRDCKRLLPTYVLLEREAALVCPLSLPLQPPAAPRLCP